MRQRIRKRFEGDVVRAAVASAGTLIALLAAVPLQARQAPRRLALDEAIRMAEQSSEEVAIAGAGVLRSRGQLRQARSDYFPQVLGSLSYTRTLASEFSALSGSSADTTMTSSSEPCGTFMPNPSLPLQARVDSLESALRCKSEENPFAAFRDLPFGRENAWSFGFSVSQTVFSGGRVGAQTSAAEAGRRVAEMNLTSARAQLVLDVAAAYYDAALAEQLYNVASATMEQAETTLKQVRLGRDVGNQPEFELLRAQVTRDTQEPLVIQRRSDRDLALLRLKQFLDIPADLPVELTTALDGEGTAVVSLALNVLGVQADTSVEARLSVRQADESLRIREAQRSIARASRLPSLSVNMQYNRVGYPGNASPFDANFRTNWTLGASVQLPIFTGGRLSGGSMIAQADLDEARARLEQTREVAALDSRDAVERLAAAEASWNASSGTVQQAERAYSIAQVRFTEGISTQLELNDSRIVMQQAQINRALAARNLHIARLRVALLPWLPLGAGAVGAAASAPSQAAPQSSITAGQNNVTTQAGNNPAAANRN